MLARRLVLRLLATAVAGIPVAATAQDWKAKYAELVLGKIPEENASGVANRFAPLAEYLSKELGTKVTLRIANDYAAVIEGQRAGHIHIAIYGPASYARAYATGVKVEPFAIEVNEDGTKGYHSVLWVKKDSSYQKIEDLKGKTVAVIAANTSCVLALRTVFERNGWPADFLKFTVVSPPDQVAAFAAKRVDASCMFDPYRLQMKKQFGARAIWNIRDARFASSVDGNLVMGRDFVDKNPKTIAGIQRAIGRAADEANRDPELVYVALAAALKRDVAQMREMSLPKFASPPSMPDEVRAIAQALHHFGFVDKPIDVAGYDRSVPAK
jgi:phosphate/phosphite/phosphonate ABC transporter binding protein